MLQAAGSLSGSRAAAQLRWPIPGRSRADASRSHASREVMSGTASTGWPCSYSSVLPKVMNSSLGLIGLGKRRYRRSCNHCTALDKLHRLAYSKHCNQSFGIHKLRGSAKEARI
jgi:hypothetical protein